MEIISFLQAISYIASITIVIIKGYAMYKRYITIDYDPKKGKENVKFEIQFGVKYEKSIPTGKTN
ncbi:MAG: hypothetical protein PHN88_02900 [Ignavibacteria bacterium]|nr:hypothetical protein [Ignavibacteria bacterium]